jgi:2-polyprenyl-6-methoxyphenol hydroxylase-like FAD-dependent oxidoreductase
MIKSQVLIVGAGPTGLMLALRLQRCGIPFRIIDKNDGPGAASRAIALHARTLEFYQQLGLADEIVALGLKMNRIELRQGGKAVAAIVLENMGRGLSPYPFMLNFPQDDHERFLADKLGESGAQVEWGVSLKHFSQDANYVRSILECGGKEEIREFDYLCGCDGASSRTRHILGLDFPGGTYSNLFFVADVKIRNTLTADGLVKLDERDFALIMPVRSSGMHRLIGILPPDEGDGGNLAFEDIQPRVEKLLDIKVSGVNWFSTYRVHHRVAEKFHVGRCFILGDAGHVHSPAGGQGMNTGIGDAVNLSWKLAQTLQGKAPAALLDTYEPERIAFARKLVATTDTAFHRIVDKTLLSRTIRRWVIPHVLPLLTRIPAFRSLAFRTVSQIGVSYRGSALSHGSAGKIQGGDRLPWVVSGGSDNFKSLQSMNWQLHIYGRADAKIIEAAQALHLLWHEFAWSGRARKAGLAQDAAYLIRPDGHVAIALPDQDTSRLVSYDDCPAGIVFPASLKFGKSSNTHLFFRVSKMIFRNFRAVAIIALPAPRRSLILR